MATTTFKLNTGASIPALGLGTWQSEPGQVETAVAHALNVGYKHIDCAYMYGNEDEVGAGLREAFSSGKVAREDIFLTTKLWCTFVGDTLPFPYQSARCQLGSCLKTFIEKLQYLEMLFHECLLTENSIPVLRRTWTCL